VTWTSTPCLKILGYVAYSYVWDYTHKYTLVNLGHLRPLWMFGQHFDYWVPYALRPSMAKPRGLAYSMTLLDIRCSMSL
jgi:hypothetical protein